MKRDNGRRLISKGSAPKKEECKLGFAELLFLLFFSLSAKPKTFCLQKPNYVTKRDLI
jgi:hypothetical protein